MRKAVLTIAILLAATTAYAAQNEVTVRSLKVLVPIYRGAPGDQNRLDDNALAGTKNGVELGRLFYYRNTQGRLNIDVTYMIIDQSAPKNDGPTYDYIVQDLKKRGVKNNEYDGIFCTGVGFTGNWGGFRVFGKTGAAFGGTDRRGDLVWFPENKPNVWYGTGWTFCHEFEHALDGPICGVSGHPEMLSDHPYSDSMESYFTWGHHAAQHWDWVAHCLSSFQSYDDLRGATDSTITVIDTDGDGLPDDDPRLPMDEKRFGSDPNLADTDGDGLNDMQEFCADVYRGSNPRVADTDGDGIPDNIDRNPTVALADTISYSDADPAIDGKMDACYKPLTMRTYVDDSQSLAQDRMFACWNEDSLHLFVKSKVQCTLNMMIDTSAENGFWEGGDTYCIRATPDGKVAFSGLGLNGDVPNAKAAWGDDGLEVEIPALIGQGVSNEINWGGKRRPEDTIDGMVLLAGRNISLNLSLSDGDERALITPNWSMFDITLAKSPTDPARPSLRFSKRLTSNREPVVVVTGTSPQDIVEVVNANGSVVGERMGDGRVVLTHNLRIGSDPTSGANLLKARVADKESTPITLVIDRDARPPIVRRSADGSSLEITGEPKAAVEVFAGMGNSPVWPIGSVQLDDKGTGSWKLPADGRGFVGAYGVGTAFDKPLFSRIDPKIDFEYQGGTCDPRLPADGFCIRWTGWLNVPADGEYSFYLTTDDGSRLYLDGAKLIENWGHHSAEEKTASAKLKKGEHKLRVDYYEDYGWASAHLEWTGPGITRTHSIPVKPLSTAVGNPVYFARQTDKAGNVSLFSSFRLNH